MPQLTIYLPEDLSRQVRSQARRGRKSVSAYLADLARRDLGKRTRSDAPPPFWGRWSGDFPDLDDPPPQEREDL